MDAATFEYLNASQVQCWENSQQCNAAEAGYYNKNGPSVAPKCSQSCSTARTEKGESSLQQQISKIRANIKDGCDRAPMKVRSNQGIEHSTGVDPEAKLVKVQADCDSLKQLVSKLEAALLQTTERLSALELQVNQTGAPKNTATNKDVEMKPVKPEAEDDDDDVDLFGSDDEEEDAEAARIRDERLKAYAEKKSKKAGPIAKSSVLIDVKPWSDETDLKEMEAEIRKISMDGLIWGAAGTKPLAYGIMKLQILCTIEDEKVSVDDLTAQIEEIEDHVQSTDIAAFNKV